MRRRSRQANSQCKRRSRSCGCIQGGAHICSTTQLHIESAGRIRRQFHIDRLFARSSAKQCKRGLCRVRGCIQGVARTCSTTQFHTESAGRIRRKIHIVGLLARMRVGSQCKCGLCMVRGCIQGVARTCSTSHIHIESAGRIRRKFHIVGLLARKPGSRQRTARNTLSRRWCSGSESQDCTHHPGCSGRVDLCLPFQVRPVRASCSKRQQRPRAFGWRSRPREVATRCGIYRRDTPGLVRRDGHTTQRGRSRKFHLGSSPRSVRRVGWQGLRHRFLQQRFRRRKARSRVHGHTASCGSPHSGKVVPFRPSSGQRGQPSSNSTRSSRPWSHRSSRCIRWSYRSNPSRRQIGQEGVARWIGGTCRPGSSKLAREGGRNSQ